MPGSQEHPQGVNRVDRVHRHQTVVRAAVTPHTAAWRITRLHAHLNDFSSGQQEAVQRRGELTWSFVVQVKCDGAFLRCGPALHCRVKLIR